MHWETWLSPRRARAAFGDLLTAKREDPEVTGTQLCSVSAEGRRSWHESERTSRLAKQATGGQLAWASGVHIRPVSRGPHWAWDSGVPCCGPLLSRGRLRDAAPDPIPLPTAGAGFQGTGEGQRASPDVPSSQQHPRPECFLTTKEEKNERPAAGKELEFRGDWRRQVPTRRTYRCLRGPEGDSSLSSSGSCTGRNPLTAPHLTDPPWAAVQHPSVPLSPARVPCPLLS